MHINSDYLPSLGRLTLPAPGPDDTIPCAERGNWSDRITQVVRGRRVLGGARRPHLSLASNCFADPTRVRFGRLS
jgi:hypothetical protein